MVCSVFASTRVSNARKPTGPLLFFKFGNNVHQIRPGVIVGDRADHHAVDQHLNRRAREGDGLGLRRQCPAEVDKVRAADALALEGRINRAEGNRGRRIVGGDRAARQLGDIAGDELPALVDPIAGADHERKGCVAAPGQRVGEQHEAPAGAVVREGGRVGGLDIGPRAADEDAAAHVDFVGNPLWRQAITAAVRPCGLTGDRHPANDDFCHSRIVEGPPGQRDRARDGDAIEGLVDHAERRVPQRAELLDRDAGARHQQRAPARANVVDLRDLELNLARPGPGRGQGDPGRFAVGRPAARASRHGHRDRPEAAVDADRREARADGVAAVRRRRRGLHDGDRHALDGQRAEPLKSG